MFTIWTRILEILLKSNGTKSTINHRENCKYIHYQHLNIFLNEKKCFQLNNNNTFIDVVSAVHTTNVNVSLNHCLLVKRMGWSVQWLSTPFSTCIGVRCIQQWLDKGIKNVICIWLSNVQYFSYAQDGGW